MFFFQFVKMGFLHLFYAHFSFYAFIDFLAEHPQKDPQRKLPFTVTVNSDCRLDIQSHPFVPLSLSLKV